jgi:hypothetical protein
MLEIEKNGIVSLSKAEIFNVNGGELPYTENSCRVNGQSVVNAVQAVGNFFGGLWNGIMGK